MTSTTKSHSLLYFQGAGRAEAIRILLSAAGVPFDDVRLAYAEWKDVKPTTPLGAVPVLTIDGVPHVQSVALARYAARLAPGWYPTDEDPFTALVVDEVMETLGELSSSAPRSGDPQEFYKLRQAFQSGPLTTAAKFLEGRIAANGGVGFTAGHATVADLQMHFMVQTIRSGMFDHIEMTFFEAYPGIMATSAMIAEHPDVVAYYANKAEESK